MREYRSASEQADRCGRIGETDASDSGGSGGHSHPGRDGDGGGGGQAHFFDLCRGFSRGLHANTTCLPFPASHHTAGAAHCGGFLSRNRAGSDNRLTRKNHLSQRGRLGELLPFHSPSQPSATL
nr:hypothetical protein HmN_000881200 [Hymenolepis microstoma]